MIFNFYRASECLNIIDSYNDQNNVNAYRIFKQGDDALHLGHKEIFYDRHNRGSFKKHEAIKSIIFAKSLFEKSIKYFPDSSWFPESDIKLNYVYSLIDYYNLFFEE